MEDYHPRETLLLIWGLPANSRFRGRLMGEKTTGWSDGLWLLLDTRNRIEALRVQQANKGRKRAARKEQFQDWEARPGKEAEKRRKTENTMARLRNSVKKQGAPRVPRPRR